MSQFFETACRPDTAASALGQHLRVKTPGAVALAGASDVSIGTMEIPCTAAGPCTVRLATAQGTRKMVASEAITAGNPVYAAASGKVAASGTVVEGRAMEDAGANNDIIEVMSLSNTDLSTSIAQTNAATFSVDADASTPKIALSGQAAGSGNFTTTIKPEATLSGNNAIIVPEADGDTLVAVALAQTLTNKTLTAPVIAVITMTGTTGSQEIRTTTNLADALSIEDGAGDLMVFDTTTGAQKVTVTPNLVIGTKATGAGSTFVPFIPIGPHTTSVAATAAIPITNFYSTLDSNAGATTQTLADGAVIGQLKKIKMIVDNGDDVVTPANLAGGTTITFADVGDVALLMWSGTEWVAIELSNDADGATAPVLA